METSTFTERILGFLNSDSALIPSSFGLGFLWKFKSCKKTSWSSITTSSIIGVVTSLGTKLLGTLFPERFRYLLSVSAFVSCLYVGFQDQWRTKRSITISKQEPKQEPNPEPKQKPKPESNPEPKQEPKQEPKPESKQESTESMTYCDSRQCDYNLDDIENNSDVSFDDELQTGNGKKETTQQETKQLNDNNSLPNCEVFQTITNAEFPSKPNDNSDYQSVEDDLSQDGLGQDGFNQDDHDSQLDNDNSGNTSNSTSNSTSGNASDHEDDHNNDHNDYHNDNHGDESNEHDEVD